jgi:hypothetical protein
MPENGKAVASGNVSDPVALFYRELGLTASGSEVGKRGGWFMRVIRSGHEWTGTISAVAVSDVVTVVVVSTVLYNEPTISLPIALALAMAIITTLAIASFCTAEAVFEQRKKVSRFFFYTLLVEMLGLYCASFFLTIPFAWVPATLLVAIWLVQGIRHSRQGVLPKREKKKAEVLVAEAFDRFVAKNHPDIVDEKSALNTKLSALSERIRRANEVLAKLRGELEADKHRDGGRAEVIEQSIGQITLRVGQLRSEELALQASKEEIVSAFQMFGSLKDDAVSYVRLQDLSEEADKVLGEASALALQAGTELENIRERIRDGLERISHAVEKLGLSTLALEDGGSVKALYSGAERIGEQSVARQRKISLMS